MSKLKNFATALCALPIAMLLSNCSFDPSGVPYEFEPGDTPHSGVIFCEIEKERRCSTELDRLTGIDITRYNEDGFWQGRSSKVGLDFSAEALAECGGQPKAIEFRCAFPNGCSVCLNCNKIGSGPGYTDVTDTCQTYCATNGYGTTEQPCDQIARPAPVSDQCFTGACTEGGNFDGTFDDPRLVVPTPTPTPTPGPDPTPTPSPVPTVAPVVWTNALNIEVTGNSLRKTSAATAWDSGAASAQLLASGDGFVDWQATSTTTDRMCGLAIGGLPDTNPSFEDISFAVRARNDGQLLIFESGVQRTLPAPVTYDSDDRIRIAVQGGVVRYLKNGVVFYTSTGTVSYPIRVSASLATQNANVTDARISF